MSEEVVIRETIQVQRHSISEDDRHISHEYNKLVKAALVEANRLLRWGSPQAKLAIVKSAITAASRMAALDSKAQVETHRIAFEQLMDTMTSVPELRHIVTDKEILDVEPQALDRPANDQDHDAREAVARPGLHRPRPNDR